MKKNFNDTEIIEAWLRGALGEAERRGFEAQLAADANLRQEVETYRHIFGGFSALREAHFAADVAAWTQEAKTKSPLRIVANNRQSSPLKPISGTESGARILPLWRRLAVAASVVLLLGAAAIWWASQRYDNARLVAEAYVAPLSNGTMGGGGQSANELEKQFEQAHLAFKNKQYSGAATGFGAFILALETNPAAFDELTRTSYLDNARWSQLLAQFAAGQLSDEQFSNQLAQFSDTEFAEKAAQLKNDMGSFWRAIIN